MKKFDLKELQEDMIKSLDNGTDDALKHIKYCPPLENSDRLAIYQNAYFIRLKEVIDSDHPVLGLFLGDDLFDLMVKNYVKKYPSKYKSLRHFGDRLPQFLQDELPFKDNQIIASIARFERELMNVFDGEDSSFANFEDLQQIAPNEWPELKFRLNTSRLKFFTRFNTIEIWQSLKSKKTPPEVLSGDEKNWIIWRNKELVTEFKHFSSLELKLFEAFEKGQTLAQASEILVELEEEAGAFLINSLQQWFSSGLIAEIKK